MPWGEVLEFAPACEAPIPRFLPPLACSAMGFAVGTSSATSCWIP